MNTHGVGLEWGCLIGGGLLLIPFFGWSGIFMTAYIIFIGLYLFDLVDRGQPPFNF